MMKNRRLIFIELKNKNEVSKVIEKINEEIQRFKNHGYSAVEVRNIINRCYILNELNNTKINNLLAPEKIGTVIVYITHEVDKKITKLFYEKFSSEEYFVPKIDKIHVDTAYRSKQIGNVIETEFEDYNKVRGKNIDIDYTYNGEFCELHEEFTEDGRLISTCKKDANKMGD